MTDNPLNCLITGQRDFCPLTETNRVNDYIFLTLFVFNFYTICFDFCWWNGFLVNKIVYVTFPIDYRKASRDWRVTRILRPFSYDQRYRYKYNWYELILVTLSNLFEKLVWSLAALHILSGSTTKPPKILIYVRWIIHMIIFVPAHFFYYNCDYPIYIQINITVTNRWRVTFKFHKAFKIVKVVI